MDEQPKHRERIFNTIGFPYYLFFDSSLQDDEVLGSILKLDHKPLFRPASIHGWKVKIWAIYQTLVPSTLLETSSRASSGSAQISTSSRDSKPMKPTPTTSAPAPSPSTPAKPSRTATPSPDPVPSTTLASRTSSIWSIGSST